MSRTAAHLLFSYGTLRLPAVQVALFGREVESAPDALPGFVLGSVAIGDPAVVGLSGSAQHSILRPAGEDAVPIEGVVLALDDDALAAADAYETDDYVRVAVTLRSGRRAWAYVAAAGR